MVGWVVAWMRAAAPNIGSPMTGQQQTLLAPGNWAAGDLGEGGGEMGVERMSGAKGRHPGPWEQTKIPVSGGRRMDR